MSATTARPVAARRAACRLSNEGVTRTSLRVLSRGVSHAITHLKLYTVGFTQTTAEVFFGKLRAAEVARVFDTRLHRDGQLSSFAKVPDLPYFLGRLADCAYQPASSLAPTAALLKSYRDKLVGWERYADSYRALLRERAAEHEFSAQLLDAACLLCSEREADRCHRRLAAEYLRDAFADRVAIEIVHL